MYYLVFKATRDDLSTEESFASLSQALDREDTIRRSGCYWSEVRNERGMPRRRSDLIAVREGLLE